MVRNIHGDLERPLHTDSDSDSDSDSYFRKKAMSITTTNCF